MAIVLKASTAWVSRLTTLYDWVGKKFRFASIDYVRIVHWLVYNIINRKRLRYRIIMNRQAPYRRLNCTTKRSCCQFGIINNHTSSMSEKLWSLPEKWPKVIEKQNGKYLSAKVHFLYGKMEPYFTIKNN